MATDISLPTLDPVGEINKYDFRNEEHYVFKAKKGLNRAIVAEISEMKNEPPWMRDYRLAAYDIFLSKPMPHWGGNIAVKFDDIYYYLKPTDHSVGSWDDVPEEIKTTFDKLGIPEAEKKFLAGVKAQYESEVVYGSLREDLAKQGVLFTDMDTALREHPEIIREYFGTIIPSTDNKFAALNSAVWSGGSFIYVPKGVKVEFPLQAYFRINAANMGQFERTLIIVDEGAQVHYVEGCTAPMYSTESLHSAVVEVIAKRGSRVRYTTIQNWANNIYNLVTKRAMGYGDSLVE
jgi:Fe-S cluster assembly protein SufB